MKKWTEEEIQILKKFYRSKGSIYVSKRVDHSRDTVMEKAARMGLKYKGAFRVWAHHEDSYLKKHYNKDRKNTSIAKTLKRSVKAVANRASLLNLNNKKPGKWTQNELIKLRSLYLDKKYTIEQIAEKLNRPANGVQLKAVRMGLTRSNVHHWTKREHNYLIKNKDRKNYKQIANDLGLQHYNVTWYAMSIGLKKHYKGPDWTDEEKEFVRKNYNNIPIQEIAEKLGRSYNAIKLIASRMGIASKNRKKYTV
jgi:hypothetical protein